MAIITVICIVLMVLAVIWERVARARRAAELERDQVKLAALGWARRAKCVLCLDLYDPATSDASEEWRDLFCSDQCQTVYEMQETWLEQIRRRA